MCRRQLLLVAGQTYLTKDPVHHCIHFVGRLGAQASEREREVLVQRQGVEERRILEQESHLPTDSREPGVVEVCDVVLLDPDVSAVRLQQRDDELQRDALARAAATENAKRFAGANPK
jgi:hypothetical protein